MIHFIDAYCFLAWLNPRDAAHEKVARWLDNYRGRFLTTEWVLMEVADGLSAPHLRGKVVRFLQTVRADAFFEILPYDPLLYRAGFDLFAARPDKAWSLTDCISFAAMTERGLIDALTADHHFEQAGFRPVFQ